MNDDQFECSGAELQVTALVTDVQTFDCQDEERGERAYGLKVYCSIRNGWWHEDKIGILDFAEISETGLIELTTQVKPGHYYQITGGLFDLGEKEITFYWPSISQSLGRTFIPSAHGYETRRPINFVLQEILERTSIAIAEQICGKTITEYRSQDIKHLFQGTYRTLAVSSTTIDAGGDLKTAIQTTTQRAVSTMTGEIEAVLIAISGPDDSIGENTLLFENDFRATLPESFIPKKVFWTFQTEKHVKECKITIIFFQ